MRNMELKQSFGQALRILRTSRHLTQEDFSQVSSRTYLSSLERGLKSPTLEKLECLASVIGVHPVTLLACSYLLDEEHSLDDLLVRVRNELSGITLAE
ncbi:TPA: helix-turn-helix domain-containing protein [Pseudomonas aeruginosa]|uniref:helix-turn-helix domain-containing protein n=2 Tax=Pseudomonas aeruginosa TaxID=287 RepID=UPI002A69B89F|nr:helix-turn-helix transcriptional regulator [Pseudomonas aeruginosa]MDY1137559.1 helix-turn-helix transcriptional regulator [Pseudomonas aeruginosa]